jgi:hypothetical protein
VDVAERWAYGPLALAPRAFRRLSPRLFARLCAGYAWREERADERAAWVVANLMNASGHLKRAVSVADLLGREPGTSRVGGYAPETPEPTRRRTVDQDLWW